VLVVRMEPLTLIYLVCLASSSLSFARLSVAYLNSTPRNKQHALPFRMPTVADLTAITDGSEVEVGEEEEEAFEWQ